MTVMVVVQMLLAIGIPIYAIQGKGKLFENPYTKEGKEAQYKKTAQIALYIVAGLMLLLAIVNMIAGRFPENDPTLVKLLFVYQTISVSILLVFLVLLFLLNRLHDKEKKKLPPRSVAPRAAFYYEDAQASEKTTPANKKSKKNA